MFGWLRRIGERISETIADAIEAIRDRLFGREEEEEGEGEEWDEAEEREELEELEEIEELEELEELVEEIEEIEEIDEERGGEIGDEEIADLIEEEIEEEVEADAGEDDGARIVYELFEQAAESLVENEHILTTDELSRAESLLEEAAALLDELNELGEEDRAAAVDLIIEALAEVEAIVARAIERVDQDGAGCEDARGPFVSYADAVAYARSIPCPAWVYADGYGWWWVCMDDCSPEQ